MSETEHKEPDTANAHPDETDGIFTVPMLPMVQAMFLIFVAGTVAASVWSFRSGLLWTGLCILAVTVPLAALYWFILFVNPARTRIIVSRGGLLVEAPPFLSASTELAGVRAFLTNLRADPDAGPDPTPPDLAPLEKVRCMAYCGYRAGEFKTSGGRQAYVAARSDRVLCIETPTRTLILGPADLDGLAQAVSAHVPVAGA